MCIYLYLYIERKRKRIMRNVFIGRDHLFFFLFFGKYLASNLLTLLEWSWLHNKKITHSFPVTRKSII